MTPANFALCVNGKYVMPGAVVVSSLIKYFAPDVPVVVWVLHDQLSDEERRLYEAAIGPSSRCTVEFLPIPSLLLNLPGKSDYISTATYGRLALARLLPRTVARVVYLDADLLVCGDLAPLFELDLRGNAAGAVREPSDPLFGSLNGLQHVYDLKLDPMSPYFNAGVLVFDLSRLRDAEIEARCISFIDTHEPARMDQDALNFALVGAILELPPIWNLEDYYFKSPERRERYRLLLGSARVIHFVGHHKPWNDESVWFVNKWRAEFDVVQERYQQVVPRQEKFRL